MTKPNEPEALEPCCSCGHRGRMIHPMGYWVNDEIGYGPEGSRVTCTAPASICCMSTPSFHGPDQDALAIAAWNRRAPAQPVADAGGVIEVNRIATLLMDTWKRVDPNSGVAKNMCSYVATFADMARAIASDRLQSVAAATAVSEQKLQQSYRSREQLDCRFAGPYMETSGRHCSTDDPCDRCEHGAATAAKDAEIARLTKERDDIADAASAVLWRYSNRPAEIDDRALWEPLAVLLGRNIADRAALSEAREAGR